LPDADRVRAGCFISACLALDKIRGQSLRPPAGVQKIKRRDILSLAKGVDTGHGGGFKGKAYLPPRPNLQQMT